jgi:hypothetical protein
VNSEQFLRIAKRQSRAAAAMVIGANDLTDKKSRQGFDALSVP